MNVENSIEMSFFFLLLLLYSIGTPSERPTKLFPLYILVMQQDIDDKHID